MEKEIFIDIVKKCTTKTQICEALNLSINSRNKSKVNKLIEEFNVDISHFTYSKVSYTKEELINAVKKSNSISDVCRNINVKPAGGNYKTLKDKFKLWGIDTSHFMGQAWNCGDNFRTIKQKRSLDKILVEDSMYKNTSSLKIRLYNEGLKTKQCEECGIVEWNGSEISFELDHINGVNNDNRIENLRILCPNCHSQTKTFRGKNIKKYKIK